MKIYISMMNTNGLTTLQRVGFSSNETKKEKLQEGIIHWEASS